LEKEKKNGKRTENEVVWIESW